MVAMESDDLNKPFMYHPRLFLEDIRIILDQLQQEHFDVILAVARGGLIPAGILANRLGIQFIYTIQIQSYKEKIQGEICVLQEPQWDYLKNKHVLLVDDLIDEGKTLEAVIKILKNHQISTYKLVVLIDKQKTTRIKPDYFARVIRQWIYFFWEDGYIGEICV
jgi:hypoxanthine phosphoribosyltransferase